MNHYIFIGGPENLRYWEDERLKGNQWFWTANKHVRPGVRATDLLFPEGLR